MDDEQDEPSLPEVEPLIFKRDSKEGPVVNLNKENAAMIASVEGSFDSLLNSTLSAGSKD